MVLASESLFPDNTSSFRPLAFQKAAQHRDTYKSQTHTQTHTHTHTHTDTHTLHSSNKQQALHVHTAYTYYIGLYLLHRRGYSVTFSSSPALNGMMRALGSLLSTHSLIFDNLYIHTHCTTTNLPTHTHMYIVNVVVYT